MITKLPQLSQLTIYTERYLAASKALDNLEYFYDGLNRLPENELIEYHMDSIDLDRLQEAVRTLEFVSRSMYDNIQRLCKDIMK